MINKLINPAKLAALKQKYNVRYQDPETAKAFLAEPQIDHIVRLGKRNGYRIEDILKDIKDACSEDPRAAKLTEAVLGRHLRAAKGVSSEVCAPTPPGKKGGNSGTTKTLKAHPSAPAEASANQATSIHSVEAPKAG